MSILWFLIALVVLVWLVTHFVLGGPDLRKYDSPAPKLYSNEPPSAFHQEAVNDLHEMHRELSAGGKADLKARVMKMRKIMDDLGAKADLSGITLTPTTANGVPAEWVQVDGVETSRRLLYLHGGAFYAGSPGSHRSITAALARVTRSAVLVVDYRLLPEHKRFDGVADCQSAYRWILDNGPNGQSPADELLMAGDSAGGNLVLMVSNWARDQGMRQADAVIALSPATDGTVSGPSLQSNVATDPMLGPSIGKLLKAPRGVVLWYFLLSNKALPSDPRLSPIHDDLANLPPTLIHVSKAEMLYDDAVRFTNKAVAAGSPVTLQVWPHTVHVWHFYHPNMPEAIAAFAAIEQFVEGALARKQSQ
ncbi:MAG: alpha/beta hydrolase [Gammaproteobacteria bacterium]|nr:MAG: alpha/beta hydrolase [Gammaproteobacteria bacterium]